MGTNPSTHHHFTTTSPPHLTTTTTAATAATKLNALNSNETAAAKQKKMDMEDIVVGYKALDGWKNEAEGYVSW